MNRKIAELLGMAVAIGAPGGNPYLDFTPPAPPKRRKRTPRTTSNTKRKIKNLQRGNPKRSMGYDKPTIKAIQKRRLRNRLARKSRQVNR